MNKIVNFFAGAICGAIVGSVSVLLLTPTSGEELRSNAAERWELAVEEAQKAMADRRAELEAQFEQMKSGKPL